MTKIKTLLFSFLVLHSSTSLAGWSVNLGYNNPPGATLGVNLMHLWSRWAFEVGLGYARIDSEQDNRSSTILAGDLDLKYFLGGRGFRPYAQVGTGYGFGSGKDGEGVGIGIGGSFYGGFGFFAMGRSVYGYASANVGHGDIFLQAGVGVPF